MTGNGRDYEAVREHLGMDRAVLKRLARISFQTSFDEAGYISAHLASFDEYVHGYARAAD
jgi:hypothetical protein